MNRAERRSRTIKQAIKQQKIAKRFGVKKSNLGFFKKKKALDCGNPQCGICRQGRSPKVIHEEKRLRKEARQPGEKLMLSVFVALDRSGSMQGAMWEGSIESLNEYIKGLQASKIEGRVTVVAFDATAGENGRQAVNLETIASRVSIPYFDPIDPRSLSPRGMTPLYDAAAHVMNLALEDKNERKVVVILTDGHENSSSEYNREKVKTKVEQIQAAGGEVIFLGANFDVSSYTADAGLKSTKMRNVDFTNVGARSALTSDLWNSTVAYAQNGMEIKL